MIFFWPYSILKTYDWSMSFLTYSNISRLEDSINWLTFQLPKNQATSLNENAAVSQVTIIVYLYTATYSGRTVVN